MSLKLSATLCPILYEPLRSRRIERVRGRGVWRRAHFKFYDTKMKRRSFRAEREFGLIVGGVFILLGVWWFYRGKFIDAARVSIPLGLFLILLGLLLPRVLVVPNRLWMWLAEGMSFVMTRIILGIIFFLVITPIGAVKRSLGWDPLSRRGKPGASYWTSYSARQRDPRHYEKMY